MTIVDTPTPIRWFRCKRPHKHQRQRLRDRKQRYKIRYNMKKKRTCRNMNGKRIQHKRKSENIFKYIPELDFLARAYIFQLQEMYRKKQYKKAFRLIENIKTRKIPNISKELFLHAAYMNQRIRWIANKLYFIWKWKKIQQMKPQNETSLDLEPIATIKDEQRISIYYKNANIVYHFQCNNLIRTFAEQLFSSELLVVTPGPLLNPYTNEKLTLYQIISIFEQFKTKNITLPTILHLFKDTGFELKKLAHIHHNYLQQRAYRNYVKDKTLHAFNMIFKTFIEQFYPNTLCFSCMVEKLQGKHRKLFEEIMIKCVRYVNYDTNSIDFLFMADKIIKRYKLRFNVHGYQHILKHRERLHFPVREDRMTYRVRRRFIFRGSRARLRFTDFT